MKTKVASKTLQLVIGVITLFSIVVFIFSIWRQSEEYKSDLKNEAATTAKNLSLELRPLMSIADRLAIEFGKPEKKDVEATLRREVEDHPGIFGLGVAFAPKQHDKPDRLYAPYLLRKKDGYHLVQVESKYDYTKGYEWWDRPLEDKRSHWLAYYGEASKSYIFEYVVPIIKSQPDTPAKVVGIVCINYSYDDLRKMMSTLQTGRAGFGTIISTTGRIIYHPEVEYIKERHTIFSIADELGSEQLRKIGKDATKLKSDIAEYYSSKSGQNMWFVYVPIPETQLSLNMLAVKNEWQVPDTLRRIGFALIAAGMIFCMSFTGFSLSSWRASIAMSLILFFGIALMWAMMKNDLFVEEKIDTVAASSDCTGGSSSEHSSGEEQQGQRGPLTMIHPSALEKFKEVERYKNEEEKPIFIPTGIFVQSIRFNSAKNVVVTGYVWQDYKSLPGMYEKKSVFPVFPEAEETTFEDDFEVKMVRIKHFRVILRESFGYTNYPFDRQCLWLKMRPRQFHQNIVLVPDLNSYPDFIPHKKLGLEKSLVLGGWRIKSTFFNIGWNTYKTSFGIVEKCKKSEFHKLFPELYFNVKMQREFLNPFVRHLIPLFVVILILFFILLVQRKHDCSELYGFNSLSAVMGCSGLFFVVIFNHIAIRTSLESSRVVYMEYLYFITYLAILYVSANSFLVARYPGYNASLSRRGFFPVLMVILYLLTLVRLW